MSTNAHGDWPMKRLFYDPDHEPFRRSVREFVRREVVPHLEEWDRTGEISPACGRQPVARVCSASPFRRSTAVGEPRTTGGAHADIVIVVAPTRQKAGRTVSRCSWPGRGWPASGPAIYGGTTEIMRKRVGRASVG